MAEYDIDLKTLEDMCSELSEACVLVNKDIKILWSNSAYDALSSDPNRLLSEIFIDDSVLAQVFRTGRLMNLHSGNHLKVTCIPVRYEDKVSYVLCIIDNLVHTPILNHFLESMNRPAILFDHDMLYIAHNSLLDKEFKQAPAVLDVALTRLKSYDGKINDKLKTLKSLVGLSHDVKLKTLHAGKQKSGYALLLYRKKSSKGLGKK
jgi:hypothetical protein